MEEEIRSSLMVSKLSGQCWRVGSKVKRLVVFLSDLDECGNVGRGKIFHQFL